MQPDGPLISNSASDPSASIDAELKAFYDVCIAETPPLDSSAEGVNRTSLRMAPVTALEIIYGSPGKRPYIYIAFDLAVEEPADLAGLERLMGFKHVDGVADLTMRVGSESTEHSKGTRYDMEVKFLRDPQWREAAQSRVLRRACFARLRLYHVLDLLRMSKQAAQKVVIRPDQHVDAKLLPFIVADILRPYSSKWDAVAGTDLVSVCPEDLEHIKQLEQYTSSKFHKRWCSEGSSGDGSAVTLRLRSKPTDDGPFFLFPKRAPWLRDNAGHVYTLKEFCGSILGPSNPPESHAKIVELVRYANYAKPKHQFVTLRAVLKVEDMPELDFWIRIDRSPDRTKPSRKPSDSSSVYLASDRVAVNYQEDQLVDRSACHALVQSQYPDSAQQASLREISKVLDIFSKESTNYVLLTENCWYLAALVQEFVAMDSGSSDGGKGTRTWAMKVPTGTRKRVLKLWNDNRSDTSLVEGVTEVQDGSDIGSVRVPSVHSVEGEDPNAHETPQSSPLPESRESTVSKTSWLFKRQPRRSSTARSMSAQLVDEPEDIIYEDPQLQLNEKGPISRPTSYPRTKRTLNRAMTIITLGKKSLIATKE